LARKELFLADLSIANATQMPPFRTARNVIATAIQTEFVYVHELSRIGSVYADLFKHPYEPRNVTVKLAFGFVASALRLWYAPRPLVLP
jgi:hypothetical protein